MPEASKMAAGRTPTEKVDANELKLLLAAVYERYGYDLRDYALPSMSRRVQLALARSGLPDLGALRHRILVDAEMFARVLANLTVQVSELFRDPIFYRVFRERVVPVLRTYPLVNVWHAGCATGEEAYSTAILLKEEGLLDRCQIYATDLSAPAIERAKQGVFSAPDFNAMVDAYRSAGGTDSLSSHATIAYGQIAIKESLRSKILFFQHDLVSDYVFAEVQAVFCRNVLIYFGRPLRDRVLGRFSETLCPGGFLCLGSSERLSGDARGPFVELDAERRIYRLRGAS